MYYKVMYSNNISLRRDPLFNVIELTELREFLQERQLSLYYGVPVSDLEPVDSTAAPPSQKGWISFLVCREDDALLAAYLPRETWERGDPPNSFPGLLTLELPDDNRKHVKSAIQQALEGLLDKNLPCRWRFLAGPVPPRRLPDLARARLIEWTYVADCESCRWLPSQYGIDCGLILGYQGSQVGTWYSSRTCVNLKKILAWESPITGTKAPVPLATRISRLNRELSRASVEAVRRFANTPLDDYMKDFPRELAQIRDALPVLGNSATYQDTAALVYLLFQDWELWPKELREHAESIHPELGEQLMYDLALPLWDRLHQN